MQGTKQGTFHIWSVIVLTLCLLGFAGGDVLAQDGIIDIYGAVKDADTNKKLGDVTVTVKQNGGDFDQIITPANGKFEFQLPLGNTYMIVFTTADYVTKKIEIDTKSVPTEDMEGGFQLQLDMSLFLYVEGFNTSILDAPIGKAGFDPVRNSVEFDFAYTERIQQKVEDEFERLEKLAGEMERMLKEFQDLLDEGDRKMTEEKFADAVGKYEKALEIFPDKAPAPEKLAAAQKALAEQEADQELEANYQRLLSQAKSDIKKERFEDARDALNEAIGLKPDEREPRDLLDDIAKQLADLEKRAQYEGIIASADKDFNSEKYEAAITAYESALELFPTEKYPREKITAAQRILDERNAAAMAAEEIERQYNDLITLGDRNFTSEDYEASLRNFQQASNLKPDERYPKDKIAAIEQILEDLAAAAEANAASAAANAEAERIDKEYRELIKKADQKFDADDLESARTDYQAALDLKSGEKYPRSRITRIDELLAERNASADADRLAEERAQREAERLAAEEAERLEREARDKEKEEERLRRLADEEAERQRLAEEKARREEEERRRSADFANNASTSTEDEAERYYREARLSEERAKTKAIETRKEEVQRFLSDEASDARDRREDNLEAARGKDEQLERIYRDGEMNRSARLDESERKKQDASEDLVVYASDADMRREMYEEKVEQKEEYLEAVAQSDSYRQIRVDAEDRRQERIDSDQEAYIAKGDAQRADNGYDVRRAKEGQRDMQADGEDVRLENVDRTEEKKAEYRRFEEDSRSAANQRLAGYVDDTERKKEQYRDISEGKEELVEEQIYEVEKEKERNTYLLTDKAEEAKLRSYDRRKELFDKNAGEEKAFDDYILPEGAEDLEEGVQERSYEEGNKMVIERTVKRGNKVDTYRKVISKTGIYYFKNGRSITEVTWKRETLDAKD